MSPPKKFTYHYHSQITFRKYAKKLNLITDKTSQFYLTDELTKFKEKIVKKFKDKKNIKGIICGSDIKSLLLVTSLQELGYKINTDVHIISKGITSIPEYFYPEIPYFYEDMEFAGKKLGEFLLERINGSDVKKVQMMKKVKFINMEKIKYEKDY